MEMIGFWIAFCGQMMLLLSIFSSDKMVQWVEQKLRVPWYVQIFTPAVGVLMAMAGWHAWCIGNQGRYPGYPLDVIIEWFQ